MCSRQGKILFGTCAILVACLFGRLEAANLVSHYTFDSDATNSVGGATDGTLVGDAAIGTSSKIGAGSLATDGDGDLVDIGTEGEPSPTNAFSGTVAFWFKNNGGGTGSIFFGGTLNQNDSTAIQFGTNGVGGIEMFIRGAAGGNFQIADGGGAGNIFTPDLSYGDGGWHHIAYTYDIHPTDNTQNQFGLFLDGAPMDPVVRLNSLTGAFPLAAYEFPMYVGARNNRGAVSGTFNGMLDDYRVYDGPLTLAEIRALPGVPEPSSLALGGLLVIGLSCLRRTSARI